MKMTDMGKSGEAWPERYEIGGREKEFGQQKLMVSVRLECSGNVDSAVTLA